MNVLVTGGAGYIGSHTVLELIEAGENVVIIDDLSTGNKQAVPDNVKLIIGDIGDQTLVESIMRDEKIESIMHFAGSIIVPESVTDPLKYYFNNTAKSRTLIAAAVQCSIPYFIFSSTAAVYGMPRSVPVQEDAELQPLSPYGTSKLMTELMLADVSKAHNFHYGVLRYFNVAGADPQGRTGQSTPNATHLIKVACQTALGQHPYMEIFGTDYDTPDGTCVRDFIQVTDLARAHVQALHHLRSGEKSFIANCGDGHGHSVRQVVDAIKRISNVDFPVKISDRRPGDPAMVIASAEKIQQLLKWHPQYADLDSIVSQAYAWEKHLANLTEKS